MQIKFALPFATTYDAEHFAGLPTKPGRRRSNARRSVAGLTLTLIASVKLVAFCSSNFQVKAEKSKLNGAMAPQMAWYNSMRAAASMSLRAL